MTASEINGWVYVVASRHAVKVGMTYDLASRLSALRGANSAPIEFVAAFELPYSECRSHEARIHRRLRRHSIAGEWFSVTPARARAVAAEVCKAAIRMETTEPTEKKPITLAQAERNAFDAKFEELIGSVRTMTREQKLGERDERRQRIAQRAAARA